MPFETQSDITLEYKIIIGENEFQIWLAELNDIYEVAIFIDGEILTEFDIPLDLRPINNEELLKILSYGSYSIIKAIFKSS